MKPAVLVVDDEAEIHNILRTALTAEGYEVLAAGSAAEFRRLDHAHSPDIYLIDVSLPDGNGFNLLKELREVTDKGIIMITGRSDEVDHVIGLEIGADDYVAKPFRIRELCSRVNALHRRIQRQKSFGGETEALHVTQTEGQDAQADFTFDGYRLSVAARRLRAPDGAEVPLTTAEFDLLVALLKGRGKVLGRDQIMHSIKGRDWESHDRAIDGLVSRLRRKLGPGDGGATFIRTVHGLGYCFVR